MKVISLLQPWASLTVLGKKKIETRSWNTKFRGQLLIHASASYQAARQLCKTDPFNKYLPNYAGLPYGKIIGLVNIVDVVPTAAIKQAIVEGDSMIMHMDKNDARCNCIWELTNDEMAFGDYSEDRYAWLMNGIQKCVEPIPAKGKLQLWEAGPEIMERIPFNLLPINQQP